MAPSAANLFWIIVLATTVVGYVLLVGAANVLRKTRGVSFGWTYHAFALVVPASLGLYYGPTLAAHAPDWLGAGQKHFTAAAIILTVFPAVRLLNRLLWVRSTSEGKPIEAPRILADTTGLVVFAAVLLLVLHLVYAIQVPGLLAGSGVVAIIIGLAMQDLLGNIFGGLAIYLEKPFKPGDWLNVDGRDAQVIEVTWRATRLLTNSDIHIEIPNSVIVRQTITNYEKPTPQHAIFVSIGLHYDVPPARAQEVLATATKSVPGVVQDPAPRVRLKEFADSSIIYEIKFWIGDHRLRQSVSSAVRVHAWYAVRRAGMEIPFPIVTLHRPKPGNAANLARAEARRALDSQEIFRLFRSDQLDELVGHSRVVLFAPTEHVINQGATGDSMFVLVQGSVEVRHEREGRTHDLVRLGPGDCFGEMSMLTGEPRMATVIALDEVEAVEISREVLSPLIHESPDVLERLSALLAERQAANEQRLSLSPAAREQAVRQAGILGHLRRFFSLGS